MSSQVAPEDYLPNLMRDNEELVESLSCSNPMLLCKNLFENCILSSEMYRQFDSLDHSRLKPQLLVRYLLRLIDKRSESVTSVWDSFLEMLITDKLIPKSLSDDLSGRGSLAEAVSNSSHQLDVGDEDIPITSDNVGIVTELIVEVSLKWELLAISLGLKKYEYANFKNDDPKISLYNTLVCWISNKSPANLSMLKKALSSRLVGYQKLAEDLHLELETTLKVKQTLKPLSHSKLSSAPIIKKMSCRTTEVEDGKSTLLYVLASPRESVCYQWHKNGQPLTNNSTYSGVDEDILVISPAVQGTEGEYTCCVSLQDKQIISNEINLKVIYSQEKKQLLDLYRDLGEVPKDSWPPVGTKTFINLVLIKSEKQHTDPKDDCVSEDADKVTITKEKVEYENIFGEYESGSFIVIEGRPGSGKTTLIHKLVKDWSNGTILRNAKLVFLITLRSLSNTSIDSKNTFGYLEEYLMSPNNNGEGACILLDGLDEVKLDKTSVISRLLAKNCLTRAMIIVSSRPAAVKELKHKENAKWLQTFGFSKEQIVEYIKSFPFITSSSKSQANSSYSSALEKYLHNHPNVFHMCYLPVHAAMICYLYKHKGDNIPNTQTKIYEEFTLSMILRHLKRYNNETKLTSLTELSGDSKNQFDTLCKIAFTMSTKHVQVITKDELDDVPSYVGSGDTWCLGLLTVHHTFKPHGEYKEYTFLHLTFQEFLTAYFIARLTKEEQLTVIQNNTALSSIVWIFLCGLLNFEANEDLFSEIYSRLGRDLILCLSCAFESQQKAICDEVLKHQKGKLEFCTNVTSLDITCVNYVTTNASELLSEIDLPTNNTLTLLQNIHEKHLSNLKKLTFYEVIDDPKDLQNLGSILELCTQLKEIVGLKLSKVEHKSAQYISEAFQTINLRYLKITCTSSSEGILLLLSGLKHHTQLKLDVTFVELCPNGVHEVVMGLCIISHIRLSCLRISQCKIDTNVTLMIAEALQNYHALQVFEMNNNTVDDVFAVIVSSALPNLMCLCELRLIHQNLDDEATVNIASGLIYLTLLETLDLSHNNIGPQGAAAIGGVLLSMTELKELNLSHNNIGSSGTAELVNRLDFANDGSSRLNTIDMSNNNIGSTGATMLAIGLSAFPHLTKLFLSNNKISDDGAAAIGELLHSLKNIDLSNNSIGPTGAQKFATVLKNFPHLIVMNLSKNNIGSDGVNAICNEFHHLTELFLLDLSHNGIEHFGVNAKKGLSHLNSLRYLDLSGNCIDINSAIRVIQALKCCDIIHADLSRKEHGNLHRPLISVQGIVSEEDESAIAALEAAAQHRSSPRTLDLGFTCKVVEAAE